MIGKYSASLVLGLGISASAMAAPAHKLLFFTKSSGYEHDVISWKHGQPSFAEKQLTELGSKNHWTFEFSKDGSKFSPDYLKQFDAIIFYTTGDLTTKGTDGEPPMTKEGKQALFDYVKSGRGFIGLHSASDTFHTANGATEPDEYIKFLGGEFVAHGAQQNATCTVIDARFPGFKEVPATFSFDEEWYALKNLNPDMHALTVIDAPKMKGGMYERPPYPNTWARKEGKGRVFYTALGHREDVWTNPIFREILIGAIHWTTGDVKADVPSNLKTAAPEADKLGK